MKKFGLSPLSPLPHQALIQPFESTDRQTVWLELHPELWSDCVFPFNPAHGKTSFAASLSPPPPSPKGLCNCSGEKRKKKKDTSLDESRSSAIHLSLPSLQISFLFPSSFSTEKTNYKSCISRLHAGAHALQMFRSDLLQQMCFALSLLLSFSPH